jgi:large subunit ribosomal protein L19
MAKTKAQEYTQIASTDVRVGMTVRVHNKIVEGEKERTQVFEGIIIGRKHGKQQGATITIRKVSDGVGVERIFPIHSPVISKIEAVKQAKVRRAKLNYLRSKAKPLKETAIKTK